MDVLWQELSFGLGDTKEIIRVLIRLSASFLLDGLIGLEREKFRKPAGLRTHILVSLGTTVFVLGASLAGMQGDALSRIIQGIITGIGFVGAGAIMKIDTEFEVKGLTSAAGIWVTAAIGIIVGLGESGLALMTSVLALIVLTLVTSVESVIEQRDKKPRFGKKTVRKNESAPCVFLFSQKCVKSKQ